MLDTLFAIAPVLSILLLPVMALLAIAKVIDTAMRSDDDRQ